MKVKGTFKRKIVWQPMARLFAGGKQAGLGSGQWGQSILHVGPTSSYFPASIIWANLDKSYRKYLM